MAKKEAKADAGGGEKPAGKSKLKLIILLVVVLLLVVGASVGATWFLLGRGEAKKDDAKDAEAAAEHAAPVKQIALYEPLAPAFVVNFNQNGHQRYMQVTVALMGRDKAEMDALKVHMPVVRNKLVMLFSARPSTPWSRRWARRCCASRRPRPSRRWPRRRPARWRSNKCCSPTSYCSSRGDRWQSKTCFPRTRSTRCSTASTTAWSRPRTTRNPGASRATT